VVKVAAAEGGHVAPSQTLVVVEAMKMEHAVKAPGAAAGEGVGEAEHGAGAAAAGGQQGVRWRVEGIEGVREGDQVTEGQVLCTLVPAGEETGAKERAAMPSL
jgi:hypothetical protein